MKWEFDELTQEFECLVGSFSYRVWHNGKTWEADRSEVLQKDLGQEHASYQKAMDACCIDAGMAPGMNTWKRLEC